MRNRYFVARTWYSRRFWMVFDGAEFMNTNASGALTLTQAVVECTRLNRSNPVAFSQSGVACEVAR